MTTEIAPKILGGEPEATADPMWLESPLSDEPVYGRPTDSQDMGGLVDRQESHVQRGQYDWICVFVHDSE